MHRKSPDYLSQLHRRVGVIKKELADELARFHFTLADLRRASQLSLPEQTSLQQAWRNYYRQQEPLPSLPDPAAYPAFWELQELQRKLQEEDKVASFGL